MTTAEDKLQIIEEILATDDVHLLEEIKLLLHQSTPNHYTEPMSPETFEDKINQAERAIVAGETTSLDEVRIIAAGWAKK